MTEKGLWIYPFLIGYFFEKKQIPLFFLFPSFYSLQTEHYLFILSGSSLRWVTFDDWLKMFRLAFTSLSFYSLQIERYLFKSGDSSLRWGAFVNHHKSTQKDFFKYGAFGTRILICGGKSKRLRSDAPTTLVSAYGS